MILLMMWVIVAYSIADYMLGSGDEASFDD